MAKVLSSSKVLPLRVRVSHSAIYSYFFHGSTGVGRKRKCQESGDCCEAETQEEEMVVLLLWKVVPSYLEGLTATPVKSGIRRHIAMDLFC